MNLPPNEYRRFEFYLVRYVPNVPSGEFTNIGIILNQTDGRGNDRVIRITRDWSRVRCLYPKADTDYFEHLEKEIAEIFATTGEEPELLLNSFKQDLSTGIQITDPQPAYIADLDSEVERLMNIYVDWRTRLDIE
jgi:Protein of unknown function (DUF3037)